MTVPQTGGTGGFDVAGVSLHEFSLRMQVLIADLRNSPARSGDPQGATVPVEAFGAGFAAAPALAGQYQRARDHLDEQLRLLEVHIDALGDAVHRADQEYLRMDADVAAGLTTG